MFLNKRCSKKTALRYETLETRICLSALAFIEHDVFESSLQQPSDVLSVDLNSDGRVDVLTASSGDNKIAWYRNDGAENVFSGQELISSDVIKASAVYAADVDSDGDMDVIGLSGRLNLNDDIDRRTIHIFENMNEADAFVALQTIELERNESRHSNSPFPLHFGDLDGDGDVDFVASSGAWYANTDGLFSEQGQLLEINRGSYCEIRGEDLDGDGDEDLLTVGEAVGWHENLGESGTFRSPTLISDNQCGLTSINTADIDGDGDLDVSIAEDQLTWYENTEAGDSFVGPISIEINGPNNTREHYWIDVDRDDDVDLIRRGQPTLSVLVGDTLIWQENLDGSGSFSEPRRIDGEPRLSDGNAGIGLSTSPADVDADGYDDIVVAAADNRLDWYRNISEDVTFSDAISISPKESADATDVFAADVDGDGDKDVVSTSHFGRSVTWFENDGIGFKDPQVIANNHQSVFRGGHLRIVDFDQDGDSDLLSIDSTEFGNGLALHENSNGKGPFEKRRLTEDLGQFGAPVPADIDGDGDLDVGLTLDDEYVWYENEGPAQNFIRHSTYVGESLHARSALIDIDKDGDLDVVTSIDERNSRVVWFENQNGKGAFGQPTIIVERDRTFELNDLNSADLNGDGHLDLVVIWDDGISWYSNIEGSGMFAEERIVSRGEYFLLQSISPVDFDSDGDIDLFASPQLFAGREVAWFENTDGAGTYLRHSVGSFEKSVAANVSDMDGDGDVDFLTVLGHSRIQWHEQRIIGDVNDDGSFNSTDLVRVFQAGEYEDEIAMNSSFEDGDWNQDGDFDSSDLVFAFQAGTYVMAAKPASAILPAVRTPRPKSWLALTPESQVLDPDAVRRDERIWFAPSSNRGFDEFLLVDIVFDGANEFELFMSTLD